MPPPLPAYDLARVLATRDRIYAAGVLHAGTVLLAPFYEDWLAQVAAALPDVPPEALRQSSRSFLGRELTDAAFRDFAWRIAGNMAALRAGRAAPAWGFQAADEWMPLHVRSAQPGRSRRGKPGHFIAFRIAAGTACPLAVRRFWTRDESRFVAARLGFNARADRPFRDAAQFVGMLLYGLFEPALCEDRPAFRQVRASGAQLRHNTGLIAGRAVKPCPTAPFHYSHPCELCTVGQDRCPLAVHARTFVAAPCPACGRADAPTDPDQPDRCVDCAHRRAAVGDPAP